MVERLTIKLTEMQMSQEDYGKGKANEVGIGIFHALMDYMYEHGNYRVKRYEKCTLHESMAQNYGADTDFAEVPEIIPGPM